MVRASRPSAPGHAPWQITASQPVTRSERSKRILLFTARAAVFVSVALTGPLAGAGQDLQARRGEGPARLPEGVLERASTTASTDSDSPRHAICRTHGSDRTAGGTQLPSRARRWSTADPSSQRHTSARTWLPGLPRCLRPSLRGWDDQLRPHPWRDPRLRRR